MRKQDGGPVFPWTMYDKDSTGELVPRAQFPGMSLRDYAIIAMMQAWRQSEAGTELESRLSSGLLVTLAAEDADTMLAERDKT